MPIFEKPPIETLPLAKDRWTPIYLEHGRLEVDDSSVKWIGADQVFFCIPIATISAILLGPGTTVTHAAIKACADSNAFICWVGEESLRFYALGITPTHDNQNSKRHAQIWADKKRRVVIARKMFKMRFPEVNIDDRTINELRGMEGIRIRALYAKLGEQYGVTWKGRNYNKNCWDISDTINRAISANNASLYALIASIICSMGFLPQLGFVHETGTLPFIYDIADLYKAEVSLPAAFLAVRENPQDNGDLTRTLLKQLIEKNQLLQRIPKDLESLFGDEI